MCVCVSIYLRAVISAAACVRSDAAYVYIISHNFPRPVYAICRTLGRDVCGDGDA
jgi:hypothetical protein